MGYMRGCLTSAIAGALLLVVWAPAAAGAQEPADTLRALYRVPVPPVVTSAAPVLRVPPASTAGSPTAYGPVWGQAFAGAGYQARARYSTGNDGTAVVGLGLGDARRLVGAEVALTSYTTVRSGFATSAGVGVKVHRLFAEDIGVAVGVENLLHTDPGGQHEGRSVYAVISQVVTMNAEPNATFGSLTASVGIGTGRFRSEQRIIDDEAGVGLFASLGIRVLEPLSILADWTGQDLALGVSISPFRTLPLVITPAMVDVTGTAGDGARFTLGVGSGFSFIDLPLIRERR